jgi:excisionase family DNA binding protein
MRTTRKSFALPADLSTVDAFELSRHIMAMVEKARVNGHTVSPGLTAILEAATLTVIARQSPSISAHPAPFGESVLISYQEAAEMLDCSVRTVSHRVASGAFEPVGGGRGRKLRRADILAYARKGAA